MEIGRDANSSENSTPRGIEESRKGKIPFLEDRGRQNLFLGVLEEFRGIIYLKKHYKILKIPTKNKKKKTMKKKSKQYISIDFILQSSECSAIIPKID